MNCEKTPAACGGAIKLKTKENKEQSLLLNYNGK